MPTQTTIAVGTTLTWAASGGDAVITLTSLAAGAGRQGGEYDFTVDFPPLVLVELDFEFGTAPASLAPVEVYWAASSDGTNYAGFGTGAADAAWTDADLKGQLMLVGVAGSNNVTTGQWGAWVFALPSRYGLPAVWNGTGQAFGSTAANLNVKVTPYNPEFQN